MISIPEASAFGFWKSRKTIRKFSGMPSSTSLYEDWLRAQPAAIRVELRAAEKAYSDDLNSRLMHAERIFGESMEGYEELSGAAPGGGISVYDLNENGSDWSWKPFRHKDKGITWSPEQIAQVYPEGHTPNVPMQPWESWRTA